MQKERLLIKKITLFGLLTALCTVTRLISLPVPNVQPVTAVIMVVALLLNIGDAMILAVLTMIISNIFLGFGIWTLPQIVSYAICVLTIGALKKWTPLVRSFKYQILVCGGLGFEYGFFVSLGLAILGAAPAFWPYWLSGLLFDTYHAIGNLVFYPLLYWLLSRLLAKYFQKQ
ncbi:ECF transporter S component [Ligilactobacillus pobuzihii]|uniref:ECF transporter S component n=1 Tax=Ligilactobacillus pobuzihii TaxID=449659 RepID=UPI0019D224D6|nr:ECF transporter S component [Ligilactobacillus pobuzihii]MBN7274021.1 ECF transporter S component [Ligilactobacillus pobuzihii]